MARQVESNIGQRSALFQLPPLRRKDLLPRQLELFEFIHADLNALRITTCSSAMSHGALKEIDENPPKGKKGNKPKQGRAQSVNFRSVVVDECAQATEPEVVLCVMRRLDAICLGRPYPLPACLILFPAAFGSTDVISNNP